MTEKELVSWINRLMEDDSLWKFYKSRDWKGRRGYTGIKEEVLREQHYECQVCKDKGMITRADTVHHVMHVKKYPHLALSKYYTDSNGVQQRNLIAVCKACHNELHPEKMNRAAGAALHEEKYENEERW